MYFFCCQFGNWDVVFFEAVSDAQSVGEVPQKKPIPLILSDRFNRSGFPVGVGELLQTRHFVYAIMTNGRGAIAIEKRKGGAKFRAAIRMKIQSDRDLGFTVELGEGETRIVLVV